MYTISLGWEEAPVRWQSDNIGPLPSQRGLQSVFAFPVYRTSTSTTFMEILTIVVSHMMLFLRNSFCRKDGKKELNRIHTGHNLSFIMGNGGCLFNIHLQVFSPCPPDFDFCWLRGLIISLQVEMMIPVYQMLRLEPSYACPWTNRQNMGLIGMINPDHPGDVWLLLHGASRENKDSS